MSARVPAQNVLNYVTGTTYHLDLNIVLGHDAAGSSFRLDITFPYGKTSIDLDVDIISAQEVRIFKDILFSETLDYSAATYRIVEIRGDDIDAWEVGRFRDALKCQH